MAAPSTVEEARAHSIQARAQLDPEQDLYAGALWVWQTKRSQIIDAPYATPRYDYLLSRFAELEGNELVQGAIATLSGKLGALDWQIKGVRGVARFQDVLQQADLGDGWLTFVEKFVQNYTTTNMGVVVELIGKGKPDGPLTGPVEGIAHLDPCFCWPTGNLEYPVVYHDPDGAKWHRLHWSRVFWVNDMKSPRSYDRGYGFCSVNRLLAAAHFMTQLSRYKREKIDNLPPSGIMTINNVNRQQFEAARAEYQFDHRQQGVDFWQSIMFLLGVDPTTPIKLDFTEFSNLPDWFNQREELDLYARLTAQAFGMDLQDVWTLDGGKLGTGAQSEVLHAKSRGKMIAKMIKVLERFINQRVLPNNLDFELAAQDTEQERERAEIDRIHIDNAHRLNQLGLPAVNALRKLVELNVIDEEDLADEEVTEAGDDTDTDPESVGGPEGDVPVDSADQEKPPANKPGQADRPGQGDQDAATGATADRGKAAKSATFDRLQAAYYSTLIGLLETAAGRRANRPRLTRQIQGEVTDYWIQAFLLGMQDGGVAITDVNDLDEPEREFLLAAIETERGFARRLADDLFRDKANLPRDAGEALAVLVARYGQRLRMWSNSLRKIYADGEGFALGNAMVEWIYGDTIDHCRSCEAAAGQVHRRNAWRDAGIEPQNRNLECGGWLCDCRLVPTDKRASGRLSRIPMARKDWGQALRLMLKEAWQGVRHAL